MSPTVLPECLRPPDTARDIQAFTLDRWVSTIATPPRIAAEASSSRRVTGSDRRMTPPKAAITGTESWTVAARLAVSPLRAAYQTT